ncbi:MAG: ABC transporter ATP-binding protein [Lachnospiraceae bacterium]
MKSCKEDIVVRICNISKKYKKSNEYANCDISLDIFKGEVIGILGPNGAGKTTLIRQLVGLLRPDEGTIEVEGKDVINNTKILPEKIAYLSQQLYAHKALKVREFVSFTGIYRGLSKEETQAQTKELIEYFGANRIENRLIEHLSGGELQIAGFMASIIGYRSLIILDEPTNDMDPQNRILLWKMVKELQEKKGITFILVTHNVREAQDVVDRVAIIQEGKIVALGKPDDIIRNLGAKCKITFELPYNIEFQEMEDDYYTTQNINDEEYCMIVESENINGALYKLLSCNVKDQIRNIKIIMPSLEDAYLKKIENSKE